eukprot:Skav217549  [mRNA]  locus=scaffold4393:152834:163780:- [translate_table: standard]
MEQWVMGCGASLGPEEITIGVTQQKRKGRKSQVQAENANKEYQERCDKIEFLLSVPLFQRLPQDEHPVVASVCESCRFGRNDVIIRRGGTASNSRLSFISLRQGARGEEFFVIQTGAADAGDHFGEGALLRDEPRAATIVAADWCRFAVSWWHTFNGQMGTDPFSNVKTHVRPWDVDASMDTFLTRVDVAFEFFTKKLAFQDMLGVDYYCFHDVDVAPQGSSLKEFQSNLDVISDKLLSKQKETGVKLLWATQNLFSHPRYKDGAATSPNFDSFAYGCAQTKKMLDVGKKLDADTHVFWGGREGFATALNTKVKSELDHMATFLKMAVAYKKKIGFKAQFTIEPKAREPTAHQYDYDAQTVIGFLYQHGLEKEFKVNIEPNHTTLAGHDYEHDLRMASALGMLGSIDCNAGQPYLGWDTDDPAMPMHRAWRKCLLSMLIVVEQGGIAPGGNNFDCKLRRESTDIEDESECRADMFIAHIGGMDCLARGLIGACKLVQEGLMKKALESRRYSSWSTALAKKVEDGKASLEEIEAYALQSSEPKTSSGKQEQLEL